MKRNSNPKRYSASDSEFLVPALSRGALTALLFLCAYAGAVSQTASSSDTSGQGGGTVRNARPAPASVVAGIAIFGNTVTAPEIILREIPLQTGDTAGPAEIAYCEQRIYSLGLFTRVSVMMPPLDTSVLVVTVEERWHLYPAPMLGIVDRDIRHWYYGLGVKHENFRGWNEKIFAGFVLGYEPWVSLYYSNPWIFGRSQLFLEASAGYQRLENKSAISREQGPNFHENHYKSGLTLGKRFDPYRSVWVNGGFHYTEVADKRPGRTASSSGIDRSLWLGAGFRHDTRNLREYPTQGIFGVVSLAKHGIGFGDVDYFAWSADARAYLPLGGGFSLGGRLHTRLTSGPALPNYAHGFFGFSERIRGHFEEEIEGENIAGVSLELRYPVIPFLYLTMPGIPYREFAVWKLALFAAVFADAGTVWDRNEMPGRRGVPSGFGAGLHAVLPYSFVVRLDRAWDEHGRGEWVIDIGAAF